MFPENTEEDVKAILGHIGVDKADYHKEIHLVINDTNTKKSAAKHPFATPCTLFNAVKQFVDLRGSVAKKTIKNFSSYCTRPED